jgi:hypothetical protein
MHEIFDQNWNLLHAKSGREITIYTICPFKCNSYGPRLYGWGTLIINAEGHLWLARKVVLARYKKYPRAFFGHLSLNLSRYHLE